MKEYRHLIDDYLVINNSLRHNGFYVLSEDECKRMLHSLHPFECPDMYAVVDNKGIIIEHFEFDASRRTRKGMRGKMEEARLQKRIEDVPADGEFHIDKGDYEITLKDWQENFERCFYDHYHKIQKYKENLCNKTEIGDRDIMVGFFVENQYPPFVMIDRKVAVLLYIQTEQFSEVLCNSPDIDFLLYGCYCDGRRQLFYVDRESIKGVPNLVDLNDNDVVMSHLNKNEVTMYGTF